MTKPEIPEHWTLSEALKVLEACKLIEPILSEASLDEFAAIEDAVWLAHGRNLWRQFGTELLNKVAVGDSDVEAYFPF